jgi:HAD superfamily hydrolase (TIGR01549 family)
LANEQREEIQMMIRGVILDFDQTIADTHMLKNYRDTRQWFKVQSNIDQIKIMKDFMDLYSYIKKNNLVTCIVSRAPFEKYIKYALKHLNLAFDYIIGYELGGFKKPSSYPMILALETMKMNAKNVIAIGDEISDAIAAKSAGIVNVAMFNSNIYADFFAENFQVCIKIIDKIRDNN